MSAGRTDWNASRDRIALVLASGFGLGYAPLAPGTVGALGGLASWTLLQYLLPGSFPGSVNQPFLALAACVLLFGVGVWSAARAEHHWGDDASRIVLDEWLGVWVALVLVPWSWVGALVGFALFRFFDIVKPWLARKAEGLGGGVGVMLDDVVAGLYANLLLQLAVRTGWL
ncbi:MAG: phosphatidylglycerophosphatase A [Bacteroidetes bacterium]|nr:phosphatidylglycerophosphatase A [Bacteroidota bacterium]